MTNPRGADHAALLRRALVAIDQLEAKVAAAERARSEPIAVIGIGCRFPGGADSPAALWRLLVDGVDAVTEVPKNRWDVDSVFDPDPDAVGKTYTRWGAFLEDIDQFDASFFGISPREAVSMDPQQRILLEVTWQALEHAGIAPTSLAGGDAAVYVGITTADYLLRLAQSGQMPRADAYTPSGTAHSMAAGRLSYVLGVHGPNAPIDTACSSSLVALHWAVQSLRTGESSLALAGGVNLVLTPEGTILCSRARMMSFNGRCRTFDAAADGYVRGEGCAMLVLKRLSDAKRDGDRVIGVIRGSAVNQDGRSSGITAPNGSAQAAVIRAALANAGLQPEDIGYVEAHGTGTSLGDPIEIEALGEVFRERGQGGELLVGSIKTNIGHTEATAGVAGVIKALLCLRHGTVPPHLHFRTPNPMVAWETLPIRVPTVTTPWPTPPGVARRAGVSAFGFSGTNAHVIIEEAPPEAPVPEPDAGRPQLLVLSAGGAQALAALSDRFAQALAGDDGPTLRSVARSAAVGRAHFPERLSVVATSRGDAAAQLQAFGGGECAPGTARGTASSGVAPELVFMFTGQGAQFAGMGMGLYAQYPVYRGALDECARLLAPHLDLPLVEVLCGEPDPRAIDDTRYTQPALFAIEYALAQLWRSLGVAPTAVLGHSIGEFVAACVAGVMSLEDALGLVAHRARLMARLPREGGMAAVFADEARARGAIEGEPRVAVAGCNGPQNTVISGRIDALERVLAKLAAQGVETQRLKVSNAFHSPLMDPILDEFEALAAGVCFSSPAIGLISNLSGRAAGDEIRSASYWRRHLREAVRFGDSLSTLARDGLRVFLEVGPHPVLTGMAQRDEGGEGRTFIASLRRGRDDEACMLEALGQLYVRGMPLAAKALWGPRAAEHRVDLPGYPFQRKRYWQDLPALRAALGPTRSGHPLLDGVVPSPLRIYQTELGLTVQPWLAEHRILDFTPLPAAAFLEIALAAGREALGQDAIVLRDLVVRETLMLPPEGTVTIQAIVTPAGGEAHLVQLFSRQGDASPWRGYSTATVERAPSSSPSAPCHTTLKGEMGPLSATDYYATLVAAGQSYGPTFRGITAIRRAERDILGRIVLPSPAASDAARMLVHPALVDACLQLMGVPLLAGLDPSRAAESVERYMPVGIERYRVHQPGMRQAWCRVRMAESGDPRTLRSDMTLFDDTGAVIAELEGVEMRRITREALVRAGVTADTQNWCFEVQWQGAHVESARLATPGGRWLVLCDEGGLGHTLAGRLRAEGATAICVGAADVGNSEQWTRVLAEGGALQGIVSLAALDASAAIDGSESVDQVLPVALDRLLQTAQALGELSARLWIVTRGAQAVSGSTVDPLHSALWGLAGVIDSEYPALRCVRVDLDTTSSADEADRVLEVLRQSAEERRVALRGGAQWVARLRPHELARAEPARNLRLAIPEPGSLGNLARQEAPRDPPGAGEVEVRVHATGLNFRDVLNALGMYPGDPGPLGNECSGVISAIGDGVTDLAVGDEVLAMTDRSFATWVTLRAVMAVKKPASIGFAAAATIPVTFLTADHALNTLGRMGPGTRVLIHAITGGVGMAALQLARLAGAEVFGTAGSPAKRSLARSLGAHHVSESRSLAFVDDFKRATDGQGVDIVLNSLSGDFIPASLGLLRKDGCFVEIGKSDDWDAARVAERFGSVRYTRLYLGEVTAADPLLMRERLRGMVEHVAAGRLAALPQRIYPIERAEEAFRFMAQGQHVGKIVITQPVAPSIRGDASYLVTGALGGLGLATSEWLAAEGARHLVLLGRRAPQAEAEAALARLRGQGVQVHVAQADVADAAQLASVLAHVAAHLPPLRGIVHAAGLVDDGMLAELDMARFAPVLAPKVRGAWNLHRQTAALPLDFFVLFSSSAGLLGSPGQGNYAAANSFMDGLAHLRSARGQAALSVNWGSWATVGMAAKVNEQHQRRWAAVGLQMIERAQGVRMLRDMLQGSRVAQLVAMPLARSRLPVQLGPFFADLRMGTAAHSAVSAAPAVDMRRQVERASPAERPAVLQALLVDQLVKVLALGSGTQVDLRRSVMEMGLDSLMAAELRSRIQASLGVRVSVADLLRGPSVAALASSVLGGMGLAVEAVAEVDREEVSL